MKINGQVTLRQEQQHERALCTAILALRSVEECRASSATCAHRRSCRPWRTAGPWSSCCERGLPYREIHRLTGVSVTTIGRVARYLTSGNGGYRAVDRPPRSCNA